MKFCCNCAAQATLQSPWMVSLGRLAVRGQVCIADGRVNGIWLLTPS